MVSRKLPRHVIARDTIIWVTGLAIVIHEELTQHVHAELLIMAGVMMGLPGVVGLVSLLKKDPVLGITWLPSGSPSPSFSPHQLPSSFVPSPVEGESD